MGRHRTNHACVAGTYRIPYVTQEKRTKNDPPYQKTTRSRKKCRRRDVSNATLFGADTPCSAEKSSFKVRSRGGGLSCVTYGPRSHQTRTGIRRPTKMKPRIKLSVVSTNMSALDLLTLANAAFPFFSIARKASARLEARNAASRSCRDEDKRAQTGRKEPGIRLHVF